MINEPNKKLIIEIHSAQNNLLCPKLPLKKINKKFQEGFSPTFIVNEELTFLSNQPDEIFWLVDINGIILVVNHIFIRLHGKEKSQIEGKNYINFIPASLVRLFRMIDSYDKETHNCCVIGGAEFNLFNLPAEKQFMKYPILNAENNRVSIAGFSIFKNNYQVV
jgi:hypothetical protein